MYCIQPSNLRSIGDYMAKKAKQPVQHVEPPVKWYRIGRPIKSLPKHLYCVKSVTLVGDIVVEGPGEETAPDTYGITEDKLKNMAFEDIEHE
jgi:hypothetical protein